MRSPCSIARAADGRTGWPLVLVSFVCAASFSVQASNVTETNQEAAFYVSPWLLLEGGKQIEVLNDRFTAEVMTSDSIVFDRFAGPSSQLSWVRRQYRLGYASLDNINSQGANMFASIGMDGLRT